MWESVFPKIIEKPYLILQFNEEKLEFTLKSSHHLFFECVDNNQLKIFLREWKYQQQSLESILFQSYKKFNQIHSITNCFEIHNSKKQKLQVKFIIFPATSNSIFLTLEQIQKKNDQVVKTIQQIQLFQQQVVSRLVISIYDTLKTNLNSKRIKKLIYLRNTCYLQRLNLNIRYYNMNQIINDEVFDPKNLQEIQELFDYKGIKINFEQKSDDMKEKQFLPSIYFKRLLFEICKMAFKNSSIMITFGTISYISYLGDVTKIKRNQAIKSVWNILFYNNISAKGPKYSVLKQKKIV